MNNIKDFFNAVRFIETRKLWNELSTTNGGKGKYPTHDFKAAIKEAHPFVFDTKTVKWAAEISEKDREFSSNPVKEFSLPFESVLYLFNGINDSNREFEVNGILIKEKTPEIFDIFIQFSDLLAGDTCLFDHMEFHLNKVNDPGVNEIVYLVKSLTEAISVKRLGIQRGSKFTIKDRSALTGFRVIRYDNLYHIAFKREYEYTSNASDNEIAWQHSGWWRGHWRAFYVDSGVVVDMKGRNIVDYTRVGKNRAGEYTVKGYTWITEHVKGNPEVAEIKTHRVVAA